MGMVMKYGYTESFYERASDFENWALDEVGWDWDPQGDDPAWDNFWNPHEKFQKEEFYDQD